MEIFIHDTYFIVEPLGVAMLAILALGVVATVGSALCWWRWRRLAGRAVDHGESPGSLQSELQIDSADAESSTNPYRAPRDLPTARRAPTAVLWKVSAYLAGATVALGLIWVAHLIFGPGIPVPPYQDTTPEQFRSQMAHVIISGVLLGLYRFVGTSTVFLVVIAVAAQCLSFIRNNQHPNA